MHRIVLLILPCLLLLTACSADNDAMDSGMQFRELILSSEGCRFNCRIRTDFGDGEYTFDLSCETDKEGRMQFLVLSPEIISGICGYIDQGSGKITYNETVLSFPLLAEGAVSPVSAPWLFFKILTGGYIQAAGEDGEYVRLTVDDTFQSEDIVLELWLRDTTPEYAEIVWQGRNVVCITISEFRFL